MSEKIDETNQKELEKEQEQPHQIEDQEQQLQVEKPVTERTATLRLFDKDSSRESLLHIDPNLWVNVQSKTFCRQATLRLSKRKISITDLQKDFHDGLSLIALIEELMQSKFPYTYCSVIKRDIHCQENLALCLRVLNENKVKIINVDAFDIFKGNVKLILGLVWTLILHYQIMTCEGGLETDAQAELLKWVNEQLEPFKMKIKNFTNSQSNGKAIEALVHCLKRQGADGYVDEANLYPSERALKAMKTAEKDHYVPMLIDSEDLIAGLDKNSCMTYISMIRDEFENGPERRRKLRLETGILEKSKFYMSDSLNTTPSTMKIFVIEIRNADGDCVPHCNDLSRLEVKCKYQEFGSEDQKDVKSDLFSLANGRYKVPILADRPGNYYPSAYFDGNLIEPEGSVEFTIDKIDGSLIGPPSIVCRNTPVDLKIGTGQNVGGFSSEIKLLCRVIDRKKEQKSVEQDDEHEQIEMKDLESVVEIQELMDLSDGNYITNFCPDQLATYILRAEMFGQQLGDEIKFEVQDPVQQIDEVDHKCFKNGAFDEVQICRVSSRVQNNPDTLLYTFTEPRIVLQTSDGVDLPESHYMDDFQIEDFKTGAFEISQAPQQPGSYIIKIEAEVNGKRELIGENKVEICYVPSAINSVLSCLNVKAEEKLYATMSKATFELCLKTRSRKTIPISELDMDQLKKFIDIRIEKVSDEKGRIGKSLDYEELRLDKENGTINFVFCAKEEGSYQVYVRLNEELSENQESCFKVDFGPPPEWICLDSNYFSSGKPGVLQTIKYFRQCADSGSGKQFLPISDYKFSVLIRKRISKLKSSIFNGTETGQLEQANQEQDVNKIRKSDSDTKSSKKTKSSKSSISSMISTKSSSSTSKASSKQEDFSSAQPKLDSKENADKTIDEDEFEDQVQKVEIMNEEDRFWVLKWQPETQGTYNIQILVDDLKIFDKNVEIKHDIQFAMCKFERVGEVGTLALGQSSEFLLTLKNCENEKIGSGGHSDSIFVGYRCVVRKILDNGIVKDKGIPQTDLSNTTLNGEFDNSVSNTILNKTYFEKLDNLVDNLDGTYKAEFNPKKVGYYQIYAEFEGRQLNGSPIEIEILPTEGFGDMDRQQMSEIEDDVYFLKSFLEMSQDGSLITKHRYKTHRMLKKLSIRTLLIENPHDKTASIICSKLKIPLTHVSNVYIGKRTMSMRDKVRGSVDSNTCFSVVSDQRTLDITTNSVEERNIQFRGIKLMLCQNYIRDNSIYRNN